MVNKKNWLGTLVMVLVFGMMVVDCDDGSGEKNPTIDSVINSVVVTTVGEATSVEKGKTLQFSATVTGTNNPSQSVTWSIDETGKKAGTTISGGLLTVAADEALTSLTVRATSTLDTTKNGTKQVTVFTPTPTVSIVTVTTERDANSLSKGSTLLFSASVTGTNNPSQSVTWSIDETGKKAGTTISGGLLTVAADEALTSLTVRATSTLDTTKSGTKQVTITLPTFTTMPNLTLTTGNERIICTWTNSIPIPDSYDIYYIENMEGTDYNAATLMDGGIKITREANSYLTFTITELSNYTTYNVLIVANKTDYIQGYSEIRTASPRPWAPSASVTTLAYDTEVYKSNLSKNQDEWYKFTATLSTQTITFRGGFSGLEFDVQMYNSDGEKIGSSRLLSPGIGSKSFNQSVVKGNVYFIKVTNSYLASYCSFYIKFN